ncbi:hypothetical protein BDA96_07G041100 [Sorghum bicolor]|uniref:Uncharacterized protein n=2 Tax=Sorghum bicolor TaxID=4558 RepID=A0A921QIC3_SORBI|nr:hypothetical protein BDA96_07G041100 [Sorghum bicolor]OQU79869.1 hypothetical protein SORBI_3007G039001 [Sorghum bicolor]
MTTAGARWNRGPLVLLVARGRRLLLAEGCGLRCCGFRSHRCLLLEAMVTASCSPGSERGCLQPIQALQSQPLARSDGGEGKAWLPPAAAAAAAAAMASAAKVQRVMTQPIVCYLSAAFRSALVCSSDFRIVVLFLIVGGRTSSSGSSRAIR